MSAERSPGQHPQIDPKQFLPPNTVTSPLNESRQPTFVQLMVAIPTILALTQLTIRGGQSKVSVDGIHRRPPKKPEPGTDGFVSAHDLIAFDTEAEIEEEVAKDPRRHKDHQAEKLTYQDIEDLMKPGE